MLPLCNQFLPKNRNDIHGKKEEVKFIHDFIKNYKSGALLVHGPVGVGKTSIIYALAKELNYEVIELNASDTRNKESISKILGISSKQMSLFAKGKVILLDEAECISGVQDRGAMQEIGKMISESKWPVVITVNDIDSEKIHDLKKNCKVFNFGERDNNEVVGMLERAAEIYGITASSDALNSLALQSGSDVRAALNDLQVLSVLGAVESIESLEPRDIQKKIQEALFIVFKSKKLDNVFGVFDNVDMDATEVLQWLDENIPKEYANEDLSKAYEKLSKASVFLGRIRRQQHWRFLVYVYSLLGPGVALAKENKSDYAKGYNRSMRGLRIWQLNMKNAKRKEAAEFIAKECHVSKRKAFQMYPYLQKVIENNQLSN